MTERELFGGDVPVVAWVLIGVAVFGVATAFALAGFLQRRPPKAPPPPSKLRTVWHGRPAVDGAEVCEVLE